MFRIWIYKIISTIIYWYWNDTEYTAISAIYEYTHIIFIDMDLVRSDTVLPFININNKWQGSSHCDW